MKILTDLHTHTNVSSHAYSSIIENAKDAAARGIELIAMTNHGPEMPDSPHAWHFVNMHVLPRQIEGVTILKGIEANILDDFGNLDIDEDMDANLEFVMASIHQSVYKPKDEEATRKAYEAVIKNPRVNILGHLCRNKFMELDYIIPLAIKHNKIIEINATSFLGKFGSFSEKCKELIHRCHEYGAVIAVNSDGHICYDVGKFDEVVAYLEKINYPEELIVNRDKKSILKYLGIHNH